MSFLSSNTNCKRFLELRKICYSCAKHIRERGDRANRGNCVDRTDNLDQIKHSKNNTHQRQDGKVNFYTYTFRSSGNPTTSKSIVDSGACNSVVVKYNLDESMKNLDITSIKNSEPLQRLQRFGNHSDEQCTVNSQIQEGLSSGAVPLARDFQRCHYPF